uniref:Uncharacterized protein n=1 Tax=Parascaris univalens TaxID=6257 RepID=A0A914ZJY6_PARUN
MKWQKEKICLHSGHFEMLDGVKKRVIRGWKVEKAEWNAQKQLKRSLRGVSPIGSREAFHVKHREMPS